MKKIRTALISVFYKENLAPIVSLLKAQGVTIYSTGGTQGFIEAQGAEVIAVEDLTSYPSILGGRVKTLHPKVFGGILQRSEESSDQSELKEYDIPPIDLVVVDLYPFEQTVTEGGSPQEIIEKIDIGGISLIRAAAKNFRDVAVIASRHQYPMLQQILEEQKGATSLEERQKLATLAFEISSHYDSVIFNYFNQQSQAGTSLKISISPEQTLRYGENPHQAGKFYGNLEEMLEQLHGKALSYNNLVDIDAAVALIDEFDSSENAFAILKHTNACGMALGKDIKEAYLKALAADPVSAFGGVLVSNQAINLACAEELHKLFFEVLIAPEFSGEALEVLKQKKNRILLKQKLPLAQPHQFKTLLNGVIWQERDRKQETAEDLTVVTERAASNTEIEALLFANKLVKHTKSNTIVLANAGQLLASGVGQTSRVDALKQAISKAQSFGFKLEGAVMASDAFFPFPDCVEIAEEVGITAVVQPGGSVKDQASIDFCNQHNMAMVFTGVRHFKH